MTDTAQERTLSIEILVRERCRELSLSPAELIRRCGYINVSRGLRRLDQLRNGDFERSAGLLDLLPKGLGVPAELVKQAVETSKREIAEAREAAWRRAFKPHAIILTEKSRPEPVFLAGLIGVDALLRIDFDPIHDRASYRTQAIEGICSRLKRWNKSFERGKGIGSFSLPAFGRPTGFVINYADDRGVRFDLEGRAVEILAGAYRVGLATSALRGRPIPPGLLPEMLGFE